MSQTGEFVRRIGNMTNTKHSAENHRMDQSDNPANPGFLLLFRGKDWDEGLSNEELQQVMDRYIAWSDGLLKAGKVKAGQALARKGKLISGEKGSTVADGPFAESKEVIGGYLMLQVDTFEEAVAIAKSCPGLAYGISIEVRPVLDECPVFKRARERFALAAA
jgi:hypothetical protein